MLFHVGSLDSSALGTAQFVHFCNKLFDSVNGATVRPQGADGIRCQIRKEREGLHLKFWDEAIIEIKQWKVETGSPTSVQGEVGNSVKAVKYFRPPCLSGWIITLEGMKLLWKKLRALEVSYLSTRSLNQDPIEHLFGSVRANCGSNVNPTVPQFVAALKTSMVNGLAFVDIKRSNCEEESDTVELLNNLQNFVASPTTEPTSNNVQPISVAAEDTSFADLGTGIFSLAYVCGSIARRIVIGTTCSNCKFALLATNPNVDVHNGIIFKEFSEKNTGLTYPSEAMIRCVGCIVEVLEKVIPQVAHKSCVQSTLLFAVKNIDWDWLACLLHHENVKSAILNSVMLVCIRWWCTRKNREFGKFYKRKADLRKIKVLKHQ